MKEIKPQVFSVDEEVEKVFEEAIKIAGGPQELRRQRRFTWLPSLAEAAYVVVLAGDEGKTAGEIAEQLGLTRQTVQQILRADTEAVRRRLEDPEAKIDAHIAGGLAKMAYASLREGKTPRNVHADAWRVFKRAIELAGGLKKLAELRNLTWLPSLIEAAYVVVLAEEYGKTSEEIAAQLGITEATVRNILRADPQLAEEKLKGEEVDTHVAGSLARLAYNKLKDEGAF